MHLHNYLMFLRDKSVSAIKDASQLVLLDIRGHQSKDSFDQHRVFKSEWFDMSKFEEQLTMKDKDADSE